MTKWKNLITHIAYSYGEILCCLENLFPGEYYRNQKNAYNSINVKKINKAIFIV